ncbi:MAG: bifunctional DNA primase/polymerase [Comamonadaceae bacterium]|nr:bifunctional DNA primase/polymerase [Comamonadaceae bacterium]
MAEARQLLGPRLLPILSWAEARIARDRDATAAMKNRFGDMRDAALSYLALGWSVIPLLPGEKRPLAAWIEFQQRRATRAEVAAWFRDCPSANIAIVTGTVSGLVVLDVDVGHGGAQSLARLEAGHGRLPLTLEAITGGGGRHLYFAHPGGLLHNRAGIAPGLDLRGDGGYIVAPPVACIPAAPATAGCPVDHRPNAVPPHSPTGCCRYLGRWRRAPRAPRLALAPTGAGGRGAGHAQQHHRIARRASAVARRGPGSGARPHAVLERPALPAAAVRRRGRTHRGQYRAHPAPPC